MKPLSSTSGPKKAVTITDPEDYASTQQPAAVAVEEPIRDSPSQTLQSHRASSAKRFTGRSSYDASTPPPLSQGSYVHSAKLDVTNHKGTTPRLGAHHPPSQTHQDAYSRLIAQVQDWLHEEKEKRSQTVHSRSNNSSYPSTRNASILGDHDENISGIVNHEKGESHLSDGMALGRLEQILAENLALDHHNRRSSIKDSTGSYFPRRASSNRNARKGSSVVSSDTDYVDGDAVVPSAEVVLDNSKTMSYGNRGADQDVNLPASKKSAAKESEAWLVFKSEIVRLTHTLKLKGWRRVPLDRGGDIDVERLSGALTNAVYVVSPPISLPHAPKGGEGSPESHALKKPPSKLLLRIYGPQVEHLIDRESELQILRRLARKKIGPRLLGTFINGRFEEYFNARTLTAADLRIPETSQQIAKRMRELHDGIELLEEERDAGPFVWRNWDKWVARCEEVILWIDEQILHGKQGPIRNTSDEWKKRGLVCGVEWPMFRKMVEKYRQWLDEQIGGRMKLRKQLVFAHNDTQYGNLLRLQPTGESPLLLSANSHKQLVVIDFEYASANTPGQEFANHFTEWCYNYHDDLKPYACNALAYPTTIEQQRFLKAYVQHHPRFHSAASTNPSIVSTPGASSSISTFMLDSRSPPLSYAEEESRREQEIEREIKSLMHDIRVWRVANSAMWVAWGIVQAKVDGMDEALGKVGGSPLESVSFNDPPITSSSTATSITTSTATSNPPPHPTLAVPNKRPEGLVAEALASGNTELQHDNDDEGEFDYLGYAQERAFFFWGDVLGLGLVKREDLPEGLLDRVKVINY